MGGNLLQIKILLMKLVWRGYKKSNETAEKIIYNRFNFDYTEYKVFRKPIGCLIHLNNLLILIYLWI